MQKDILTLFDNGKFILFKWNNSQGWPVEYVSKNVLSLTGYDAEEFLDAKIHYIDLIHPDDIERVTQEVTDISLSNIDSFIHQPYRIKTRDEHYIWVYDSTVVLRDDDGNISHYIGYITDITETKKAQERASHLMTHDHLTSLPNLILFQDRVEQAILHAQRENHKFALLSLDIDNFRVINDTLGHSIGNKVLIKLSESIQTIIRAKDSICRHAGDEFFILIDSIKSEKDIRVIINKLFSLNKAPYIIDEHQIYINYSIGAVMYPDHGEDFHQLLQHVDNAMYDAKDKDRNSYKFFSKEIFENMKQSQHLYLKLYNAIENGEIKLVFQPKVDTQTKKIVGAETLVRWINKDDGFIPPDVFIPIAESSGQIVKLGRYIFQKSCERLKEILEYEPDFIMAINISAVEFKKESFVHHCKKIVNELKLNPSSIELELTESVIMDSPDISIKKILLLKEFGFKLAVDDFGTGYSSLSYLKDFPVDTIKIDISFIRAMLKDKNTLALVKIIIGFNQIFDVKIVAEGVEVDAEYNILKKEGCDIIQGYLFSKPLPFNELENFIHNNREL